MSATSKPPTTHRNFTYRLKVRRRQHEALDRLLEQQRLLYNAALQERIDAYAKARKSISYVMSRWDSISFNEAIGIRISAQGWVTFTGVPGKLRLFKHRAFPDGSTPRSVVLRKTALGWTISFLLAVPLDHADAWRPLEDNESLISASTWASPHSPSPATE